MREFNDWRKGMKIPSRRAVKKHAHIALQRLAAERLEEYLSAYDSAPENWDGCTPEKIEADAIHGTYMKLQLEELLKHPPKARIIKR
jgi:hypothetical protein